MRLFVGISGNVLLAIVGVIVGTGLVTGYLGFLVLGLILVRNIVLLLLA